MSMCGVGKNGPAAVFMAVPEEAEPFVRMCGSNMKMGAALNGMGRFSPLVWHLKVGEKPVLLCLGGMGAERIMASCRTVISRFRPSFLISAGLCGALSPSLKTGDIAGASYLANSVYPQPSEIGLRAFEAAAGACRREKEACNFNTFSGKLITSAKVAGTVAAKAGLRSKFGADIVDMEAGGIACAAGSAGLGWGAVKAVSDEASFCMPLDFNDFVDEDSGLADKTGIVLEALKRPAIIAKLCRLSGNTAKASRSLAKFLAFYIANLEY